MEAVMKTLIINGSPRLEGETMSMINYVTQRLDGEYKLVNTYYADISPCNDCRACTELAECVIKDDMSEVYDYLKICDRVILASPLYFSQYTGSFLSVMSRMQLLFSQKYIKHKPIELALKKGIVLLSGGGSTVSTVGVEQCTRIIMRELNCTEFKTICYIGTDKKAAMLDEKTVSELNLGIEFLKKVGGKD
jgi:multimeric flavodoxin WrbA